MPQVVSKAKLKPRVLEYLRQVQMEKKPLIVTHFGRPVAKIIPYVENPRAELEELRGTVVFYKKPTEPVGEEDWETLQ